MPKKRKFRVNKVRSIDSKADYADWRGKMQKTSEFDIEIPAANPDVLTESAGMYYVSEDQQAQADIVRELIRQAPQFLTAIQDKVFEGVRAGKSFHDMAREMGRDVSTVFEAWQAAQRKLQRKFKELSQ